MSGGAWFLLFALLSWPCLTTVLFRHARWDGSSLSWREDLGFACLVGLLASGIWPLGWILILCMTGFAEGVFSDRANR